MKPLLCSWLCSLLLFCSQQADPQEASPVVKGAGHQESAEVASGLGREIPFELSNGFLITVKGRIGTLEDLRFILDTGVTKTIVNRKVAKTLKLLVQHDLRRVLNFDQEVDMRWAVFPAIEFGSVKVTNVPLLVGEISHYSEFAQEADALIGLDLLRLSNLVIDFDARRVLFSPLVNAAPATALANVTPCLIVTIPAQNQSLHLILDTGLRDPLLFEEKIRNRVTPLNLKNMVDGSMGDRLRGRAATLRGVRLGASEIDMRVLLVKGPPGNVLPGVDGYLGIVSLKARRIEFNFEASTIRWR